MRPHWLSLHRALTLIAVLGSALLFVHYLAPADSDFCGGASGCEAVRRSGLSYFGQPYWNTPLFGMLAFLAMFFLGWGNPQDRRLLALRLAASLGGVTGLALIITQALVVKAFCWLCMVVDVAAVGAAFAAVVISGSDKQLSLLRGWAWGALLLGASGLPIAWHLVKPLPPVPSQIRELYAENKINVVEFADFQCPYCRRVHPIVAELVREYGERVNFRRLHKPLDSHQFAEGAARAAICAEAQGHREAMADRLFEGELGDEKYAEYASELKLDTAQFAVCLQSESTTSRLRADQVRFDAAGLRGLPTTFIGSDKIIGAKPVVVFRDAFERASAHDESFSVSGVVFLLISVALSGIVIGTGRQTTVPDAPGPPRAR